MRAEFGERSEPDDRIGEISADKGVRYSISQCAGGYLECCVGKEERAADPSPGLRADVQGVLHAGAGDGDANAIKISNHREQRQHAEHPVLVFHVRFKSFCQIGRGFRMPQKRLHEYIQVTVRIERSVSNPTSDVGLWHFAVEVSAALASNTTRFGR